MFTSDGLCYVEYETGEKELYDLRTDPYELGSKTLTGHEVLYEQLSAQLSQPRGCAENTCRTAEGP